MSHRSNRFVNDCLRKTLVLILNTLRLAGALMSCIHYHCGIGVPDVMSCIHYHCGIGVPDVMSCGISIM